MLVWFVHTHQKQDIGGDSAPYKVYWIFTLSSSLLFLCLSAAAQQFDPKLTDKDYSETVKKWLRYAPEREGGIPRNQSDPNPSQANQSQKHKRNINVTALV
ncbi:hypothetical protein ILYODFUR_038640 [Ilyodon furcidens]|uniref:Uncharacterized protein n=1 Tax=Ilyodon furcidens TaxID=33524 RepID=A0ABV0V9N2_9TELE